MAIRIPLRGELDLDQLDAALRALERLHASNERLDVVYDCSNMHSYTSDARHRFVDWHRQHRDRLGLVAIVTDNTLWHMVVSAMSLASGRSMRSFLHLDHARAWLGAIEDAVLD